MAEWTKTETSADLAGLFNEPCFTCGGDVVADARTDRGWVAVGCTDCDGTGLSENARDVREELSRRIRENMAGRARVSA